MNKSELTNTLTTFALENNYSLNELVVTHGGACLLMELTDSTNDIDLSVSHDVWVDHIKRGFKPVQLTNDVWMISATDCIDIHVGMEDPISYNNITSDGIVHHGLSQTLLDYLRLDRAKDKLIISKLRSERKRRCNFITTLVNKYKVTHGELINVSK